MGKQASDATARRLREGADAWNEWRTRTGGSKPDLRNCNLENASLRGFRLEGTRLDRANLFGADFTGANLDGANLWKADLRCAVLGEVSARSAIFREADLRAATLVDCDLGGAVFHEAHCKGAEFFECDFTRADLTEADFSEAVLSGCQFNRAQIDHTDFAGARLWHARNLESVEHHGPSWLDPVTAVSAGHPISSFLRGVGWPERVIQNWKALTSDGINFYSCFISYSHTDKTFAHRLHNELQRRGVRCWLDGHALRPGDIVRDEIDRGIRVWDKVVLCCSEAALTSWWVDQEIEKALQKEERLWRERGERVGALIPIRLDDYVFHGWTSGKKSFVVERHVGDFCRWMEGDPDADQEFEKLVEALSTDPVRRKLEPIPKL